MKKIYLLFLFLACFIVYAQAPSIEWQKTIGGNNYDLLTKIVQTSDGGYIISGYSRSYISGEKTINTYGNHDIWIIKINAIGTIEWQKTIGGTEVDLAINILKTLDGGYIIGGNSNSSISGNKTENSKGYADYWIIKLDSLGNIVWQKTIGGNVNDILESISETLDGGFLLGGHSYSNISGDKTEDNVGYNPIGNTPEYWFVKIDGTGNIQWDNTIGSTQSDYATIVLNAPDGGYLVGGYSNGNTSGDKSQDSKGGYDIWILKLDTSGGIVWQKTIGGNADDKLYTVINTADGGYLLGASSSSSISSDKTENTRGVKDYWIVKIDNLGNIIWDKTIGGAWDDDLFSLVEDQDLNFYISGISKSNISGEKTEMSRGNNDYWIVKTNNMGTPIWDKTIGGSGDDYRGCISLNSDNSIIVGGASTSSISGDKTEDSRGGYDYWIVKLTPDNLSTNENTLNDIQVYPNPTSGSININLGQVQTNFIVTVNNTLGQTISSKSYNNIENTNYTITGEAGIYFLTIENEKGEKKTIKVIKK
jgi:Secretion system C-terminal sorting domain